MSSMHGRTYLNWPLLTIAGITCAVLVGIAHAGINTALDCLLGEDDLAPKGYTDGFGADGY